ncbi:MAG TPA: Flp pilus assembly protein CpaB [Mycobacteriales bacterium]|nr:Flp pilus assembly protein CpaB [Mycobacteriales bacterium]
MTGAWAVTGAWGALLREARRALTWHRRLVVALLAAATAAVTVSALAPPPPETAAVVAASRDLAPGTPIAAGDLRFVRLPPSTVPTGSLRAVAAAVGRIPVGPVRAGEPLTDARLLGPSLVAGYAGDGLDVVAAPVRVADAGTAALLRAGDRVDVLAASTEPGAGLSARVVAAGVPVLAVPVLRDARLDEGGLVVLATTPEVASVLARAAVTSRLSVTIRSI